MPNVLKKIDPIIPSDKDIKIATESSRVLASILTEDDKAFDVSINNDHGKMKFSIPASVLKMLFSILTQMSQGNAVTLIPIHEELTTQEAANILNVSRPFLVGLLDENKIPYRKVGTRRKVLFQDIMTYKNSMYNARLDTLDALAKDGQDLDMGH